MPITTTHKVQSRKIAFMFPAAGVQKVGMGEHLTKYDLHPFNALVPFLPERESIEEILQDVAKLNQPQYTNLTVFAQSAATHDLLVGRGINPDTVAGYSLGEYSAFYAAKILKYEDIVGLLFAVCSAYNQAFPLNEFGMAAVLGAELNNLETACRNVRNGGIPVFVSNFNCPGSYLVSGKREAFSQVSAILRKGRMIDTKLNVPYHCELAAEVEDLFNNRADTVEMQEFNLGFVSSVTGQFVKNCTEIRDIMKRHLSSAVLWERSVRLMLMSKVNTFIEVGPGDMLSKIVSRIVSQKDNEWIGIEVYSTDTQENLEKVLSLAA